MNKKELRAYFREIRARVSSENREAAAKQAAELISTQSFFKTSQHIACYLPLDEEFDTRSLISTIWQTNKICYLPIVLNKKLLFGRYDKEDELKLNQYGILEPMDQHQIVDAGQLDLVIMPLLAFDVHGHRLGTGGGYYDRTFEFLKNEKKKIWMIGLGYASQQTDNIPVDSWDVVLDGVLTEKEVMLSS